MDFKKHIYIVLAIGLGLVFHGTAIFSTLETSYDALIHLFFAEHYANNWSEPWSYKWYTGFSVLGYPPLVHQLLALLSYLGGYKFALFTLTLIIIVLFITGIYRFSYIMLNDRNKAGYAALFSVFSSVFIEVLHLFGQLPTLLGISLLLHSLPEIYKWIVYHKLKYLLSSVLLIGVMTTSHHVTPIFGMVFFIFPVLGLAVIDTVIYKDNKRSIKINIISFLNSFKRSFWHIVVFGFLSLITIVISILPYWINALNDPISQVPIPHGSRDDFLEILSSGLVFFIIPYGAILFLIPFVLYRYFSKRLLFFGLSFSMLFLLGTGGTTPLPKIILGENAFSILTLDRFTFWAAILATPIIGEMLYRLIISDYKVYILNKFNALYHRIVVLVIGFVIIFFSVFTLNIGKFRPSQPKAIDTVPIINFINQDMHYKWRYLTLGFGDQMAWLSSQTKALSVDGNYHSARKLPELTTKEVERLENSKFRGVEGIGSLQQFLSNSSKFNLKYVFSNDKFYDPILFFTGWTKISRLENNIDVWEKSNIKPLPKIISKTTIPHYQKIMWSFIPITLLSITILFFCFRRKSNRFLLSKNRIVENRKYTFSKGLFYWNVMLLLALGCLFYQLYLKNNNQKTSQNVINAYYDALDYKQFEDAHDLIDVNSGISLDLFMLNIAVSDGLLSSYAKMDDIKIEEILKSNSLNKLTYKVKTKWITPLEIVYKTDTVQTIKHDNKWFLKIDKPSQYVPSSKFFRDNEVVYHNQGRRAITTQQTNRDDILPQPKIVVREAKLIKRANEYHIVGVLQNIDYTPAVINMQADLYNENNESIASYSGRIQNKYKLNPFETSSFKIDFEEIAWLKSNKVSRTYNPYEYHPKTFLSEPKSFALHITSTSIASDLNQKIQFSELALEKNYIKGILFNSGEAEVTISQILNTYYNDEGILWVSHHFIMESIRAHRKRGFLFETPNLDDIEVIMSSINNCFVNGKENQYLSNKGFYEMDNFQIELDNKIKLKMELNNFIGNK